MLMHIRLMDAGSADKSTVLNTAWGVLFFMLFGGDSHRNFGAHSSLILLHADLIQQIPKAPLAQYHVLLAQTRF